MFTERAVFDYMRCPQLLREPQYNESREKRDQTNFNGWMSNLYEALVRAQDSRDDVHVIPRGSMSYRAQPFQKVLSDTKPFWLKIEDASFYFMSTISYVEMYLATDRSWKFDFFRVCYRDFSKGSVQSSVEAMFRDYLWSRIAQVWEPQKEHVKVISVLKDGSLEETTTVSEERVEYIQDVFKSIYAIQGFYEEPQPTHGYCDLCEWRNCPERREEDSDDSLEGLRWS